MGAVVPGHHLRYQWECSHAAKTGKETHCFPCMKHTDVQLGISTCLQCLCYKFFCFPSWALISALRIGAVQFEGLKYRDMHTDAKSVKTSFCRGRLSSLLCLCPYLHARLVAPRMNPQVICSRQNISLVPQFICAPDAP